eukprot:s4255_g1.t1
MYRFRIFLNYPEVRSNPSIQLIHGTMAASATPWCLAAFRHQPAARLLRRRSLAWGPAGGGAKCNGGGAIAADGPARKQSRNPAGGRKGKELRGSSKKENDDGIAKTFDFASTRNKAVTGPLPRFAHMIHAGYPLLLNSQNFTLLSALQLGPTEYAVRVEILGNLQMGNQKGIFVWQLSDSGDGTGWRTDAVMPDESV